MRRRPLLATRLVLVLLAVSQCLGNSKQPVLSEKKDATEVAAARSDKSEPDTPDAPDPVKTPAARPALLPDQWRGCKVTQLSKKAHRKGTHRQLDCSSAGLTAVPQNPPPGFDDIRLSDNLFRELLQVQLPGVRRLDLSRCSIVSVREYALVGSTDLEYLDLTGNALVDLPPELLRQTVNLRNLLLPQNHLAQIPRMSCSRSLHTLNLAANNILDARVPADFASCSALNTLILSGNRNLRAIKSGDLAPLKSARLATLKLASCPIEHLDEDAFEPVRGTLRHVDLSGAKVPTSQLFASLARLAGLLGLRMLRVQITALRPADLQRGGLASLQSLQVTCLNPGSQALSLPQFGTFSKGAPHLQHLQLDTCGLAGFDSQVSGLTKLTTLDLARNRLTRVPRGLPATLTRLDLRGNRIETIGNGDLAGLVKLEWLELSGNRISSAVGAFNFLCRVPALSDLVLDAEELTVLERRGRFSGRPPAFPAEAVSLKGKKRTQALNAYATKLLGLVQAQCHADPLPEPANLPLDAAESREETRAASGEVVPETEASGSGTGSSGVAIALKVLGSVAVVALLGACAFLVHRYRRRLSHLCLGRPASAAAGRELQSSHDALTRDNNFNNRLYNQANPLPPQPTRRPQRRNELQMQELLPLQQSPQDASDYAPIGSGRSNDSTAEAAEAESDLDAEAGRLSRAEGGGRASPTPSGSVVPTAIIIGLRSDLAVHLKESPDQRVAVKFIQIDESATAFPDDANTADKLFIFLSENFLKQKDLARLVNDLLKTQDARRKTKICCLFQADTPDMLQQLKHVCPQLHDVYVKYSVRLIQWLATQQKTENLEIYL